MSDRIRRAERTIRDIARDVGVHASVGAALVGPEGGPGDGTPMVQVDPEVDVPVASLYKVPLAACWADLVHDGRLDPLARVSLSAEARSLGETGVATLADPVELSQRDAVRMMLTVSDNACAEVVLDLIGLDRLAAWVGGRGLAATFIRRGSAEGLRLVVEEAGGGTLAQAMARLADPRADRGTSEYDSALASSSTARDLVRVLDLVWRGPHYAWVRDSMRLQPWRHRIASGFPHDDVVVTGKTGTLGRLRHEAAVVHFPAEIPVAVAVLTHSIRPENHQPRVDAAIGVMARTAVGALRRAVPIEASA